MVPFGDFHICLRLNSLTRTSSGVMVAHFTPDAVLLDCVRGINRHLVVRCVSVLDAEVVVLELNIEVRQDERVSDVLPDDARHFVAIEFDDRVHDLNLCHEFSLQNGAPRP